MVESHVISDQLHQDIKLLNLHGAVSNVQVSSVSPNSVNVSFSLYFDEYSQIRDIRICSPEPIVLNYLLDKPRKAPSVLSGREDFPRDIAHLNPVAKESNASICLWRKGGNDALYQQRGILALIAILQQWLVDASLEQLEHDGWEPFPRRSDFNLVGHVARMQEMAATKRKSKMLKGEAAICFLREGGILGGMGYLGHKWHSPQSLSTPLRPLSWNEYTKVSCFLVTDPEEDCVRYPHTIETLEELQNYSNYPAFKEIILAIKRQKISNLHDSGCLLIVAHRRPRPMIKDIPGISIDSNASKIELVSFLLHRNKNTEKVAVEDVNIQHPATTSLLSSISGEKKSLDVNIGIVGCGALGSSIADQLARRGLKNLHLWDNDFLQVHNNARHILTRESNTIHALIGNSKSLMLADHLSNICENNKVKKYHANFTVKGESARLIRVEHLVDTTASHIESEWIGSVKWPVTRMFISDEGRIGLLQTQISAGYPDMLDLEAVTYLKSTEHSFIKEWLNRQSVLSNKMIGFGCNSATLEMPWSTIINHSSALMPTLLKSIQNPLAKVVINRLDDEGNPKGLFAIYHDTGDDFENYDVKDHSGQVWRVSLFNEVHERIKAKRTQYLPKESAGFLLGLVNMETHRISIIFASAGPCSESSYASVTLDSIESDDEIKSLQAECNNMLTPLGTWHSHPGICASPSSKDLTAMAKMAIPSRIYPTVMLIKAATELKVLVEFNRADV